MKDGEVWERLYVIPAEEKSGKGLEQCDVTREQTAKGHNPWFYFYFILFFMTFILFHRERERERQRERV